MKALTLKHPWPFAIAYLGKRIENRRWHPPRSLVGRRFAIHGGVVPKGRDESLDILDEVRSLVGLHGDRPEFRAFVEAHGGAGESRLRDTFLTGIVAVATLASVVISSDDPWFEGPFGWVLEGVDVLPEPVPCRGAQGLWDVPEDVMEMVERQLAEIAR